MPCNRIYDIVKRTVKINYNLDVLKQVAQSLGLNVVENAAAIGADGSVIANSCDLVIKTSTGDFGFVKVNDTEIDMHTGFRGKDSTQDLMAEKVIPAYVEQVLRQQGRGMRIQNRQNTMAQIVLTIGRS